MKRLVLLTFLGGILGGAMAQRLEGTAHASIGDAAGRIADAVERIARVMEVASADARKDKANESCH